MSIRASLRGGNARHPVSSSFLAFLRDRGLRGSSSDRRPRGSFLFSCVKVAAPVALVAGFVVAGSAQRGPSPIASLAEPGAWHTASVPVAATPVASARAPAAFVATPGAAVAAAPAGDAVTSMPAAAPGTALP